MIRPFSFERLKTLSGVEWSLYYGAERILIFKDVELESLVNTVGHMVSLHEEIKANEEATD